MIRLLRILVIGILVAVSNSSQAREYPLGPGDLLSITVFGEEDLSLKEVRVSTNGSISFPLLGEITVQGMTPLKLENHLISKLRDGYLKKPNLTISVVEYRDFYVHGEVKKPGGYPYTSNLTVEKAIVLAGGLTERASKGKITILRENVSNKSPVSAALNVAVKPGDVITVGESFF
ncbi:MAG: polysaccharide export protein [Gammaproteobacteria bacterium]|nr:polysaccharide export protein [Gammaproteobacteria bacterium]